MRLAGLPTNKDREDFIFVVLRECTPDKRKQIIDYMLANMEDIGLVIIDGIRDLMYDINSPSESSELINLLMKWSSEYNLHIHTVLHLNKGDDNTRGHIGTELNNKAETVLQVTKSIQDVNISEVKAMHIRDKDFEPFAFRINDSALPEIAADYIFEQPKQDRGFPLTELTEQQHREALINGFGKQVIQGYPKVIAALKEGYASIGFERGRNVLVKLNKFLVNKRMLVKEGKGYMLNIPVKQENEDARTAKKRMAEGTRICSVRFTNTATFAKCCILDEQGEQIAVHACRGGDKYRHTCKLLED